MMSRKMLGLAVTERAITAVEVGVAHGRQAVLHAAEFPLPEGDAAREPDALGRALRQFLKRNHFSCSRCVIGLGTRWLASREKSLPPTAADLMPGVLSLTAEREFASDPKDLILDCTKPVDAGQGHSVLLVAAPRRNVDHLLATAEAAGLSVTAVTSSTMALAAATAGAPASRRVLLYLAPGGAELCVQSSGGSCVPRCLPIAAPGAAAGASPEDSWMSDLAGELHRVLALLPGAPASPQPPDLVIWNSAGLPAKALEALGERLSLATRQCAYPADLGIADDAAATTGESAAAAALALCGLQSGALALDFLHSRLSPRRRFALGRKVVWAAGLAALVVIGCLALFLQWQNQVREADELSGQLAEMKPTVAAAKDIVDKTAFARGWYDRRPKFLNCLRDLTNAFPTESRIWTTSLGVGEDMRALLSGKAADERAVLEVLDRLTNNPKFSDVKPLYIREVGGGSSEVSFAISLRFAKVD